MLVYDYGEFLIVMSDREWYLNTDLHRSIALTFDAEARFGPRDQTTLRDTSL
jgi:hypothetical protein